MTDLLERTQAGPPLAVDPGPVVGPGATEVAAPPEPGNWVLGALLAGAGAIHVAVAPSHLDQSAVEGIGFLVAAWAQFLLAVAAVRRPSRPVLSATVVVSTALIVVWAASRSVGFPVGAHAGTAEDVTFVDGVAVVLEGLAVLLAAQVLVRPAGRLARRIRGTAVATVGVVGALLLASTAVASPSVRDHGAADHGAADHGAADSAHADDLGFSALANGQMGSHAHPGDEAAAADLSDDITPTEAATLAGQLSETAALVERYPTLGDAKAAGFVQQGPFAPGMGVHYGGPVSLNLDGDMDPEDIGAPTLIFDGLEADAPLAGFMYLIFQDTEPEGFAGPLDRWHYHTAVCIRTGPDGIETPFGADLTGVTDAMCQAEGGFMIDFTGYMVHVWTVPGYESDLGTFSDLNPGITCPDGTYHTIPTEEIGGRDSTCRTT